MSHPNLNSNPNPNPNLINTKPSPIGNAGLGCMRGATEKRLKQAHRVQEYREEILEGSDRVAYALRLAHQAREEARHSREEAGARQSEEESLAAVLAAARSRAMVATEPIPPHSHHGPAL